MNTERVGILLSNTLNASSNRSERSEFRGSNNNICKLSIHLVPCFDVPFLKVIEAQSFSDEDLQKSEMIQFSFDTFTNNTMLGSIDKTPPMVEIPTTVVVKQMELSSENC